MSIYQHVIPKWSLWPHWSLLSCNLLYTDANRSFTKNLSCFLQASAVHSTSQSVMRWQLTQHCIHGIEHVWGTFCNFLYFVSLENTPISYAYTGSILTAWTRRVSLFSFLISLSYNTGIKYRNHRWGRWEGSTRSGILYSLLSHSFSLV